MAIVTNLPITYGPKIVTDNLIFYGDFGNRKSSTLSGTTLRDLTVANPTNLTISVTPTYSTNNLGYVICNGTNNLIYTNTVSKYQFANNQPFSLCYWLNWTEPTTSTSPGLFQITTTGNGILTSILSDLGGRILNFIVFGNSIQRQIRSTVAVQKNVWQNIVFTQDNSNSAAGMNVYINGLSGGKTIINNNTPGTITYAATSVSFATPSFEGNIAQMMCYNKQLTASEVLQNYEAMKGRFNL